MSNMAVTEVPWILVRKAWEAGTTNHKGNYVKAAGLLVSFHLTSLLLTGGYSL